VREGEAARVPYGGEVDETNLDQPCSFEDWTEVFVESGLKMARRLKIAD
jgi:hypothetical protein